MFLSNFFITGVLSLKYKIIEKKMVAYATILISCKNKFTLKNFTKKPKIITDKVTGLLFEPGNTEDLINKINWIKNNPIKCDKIVKNARKEFLKKYTPEINYVQLLKIYNKAINDK